MSVKTIFYTIIGTMVIIIVGSLTLEWFNISTTSLQLGSMAKMSARQACVFFGQETYKREDFTGVNMDGIFNTSGELIISGDFYPGGSPEDTYNSLYANASAPFKPVYSSKFAGNWESLDLMMKANDEWGIGEFYRDVMMTPLNLGITYLDHEVIDRIFKWNFTSILNNGQVDESGGFVNLHRDEKGPYILYKGFRVYVTQAEITDVEYRILNLSTSAGQAEFKKHTNMDASIITDTTEGSDDERNKVCLAGIKYSVPMKYVGITPIKRIAEWGWSNSVDGADGQNTGASNHTWNDMGEATFAQGGFDGAVEKGVLPVPGELVYYIVR